MPLSLKDLQFDNRFARLGDAFSDHVDPTPVSDPYLISYSKAAMQLIDLAEDQADDPLFTELFAGNRQLDGFAPRAAIYAGHQFGHWVPQLGDGRALLLGQVRNADGNTWELNLKGAGITPYSRSGDGRAVLRSSIREYLCSEHMHGLGIPTTRALCLVGTDDEVYREQIETGALVLRMAESHVRFGSFELFFSRGQTDELKQLADYVIDEYYPEIPAKPSRYRRLLREVIRRTALLMAQWQAVGFAHGVMNTDNMSILGLTLDYGPYGFLDNYDSGLICNHSDHQGRYSFEMQPGIGLWNLQRLAQALSPLVPADEAVPLLKGYEELFIDAYLDRMTAKLGFAERHQPDAQFITHLLQSLQSNEVDYTLFFRRLCDFQPNDAGSHIALRTLFKDPTAFDRWAPTYQQRLDQEDSDAEQRSRAMKAVNPKYVLRNYLAETAIRQAKEKDYSEINNLLKVLQSPYEEWPEFEHYAEAPPEWAGWIEVSCSS